MSYKRYVKVGIESSFGGGGTPTALICTSTEETVDRGVLFEESIDNYVARAAYGGPLKLSGTLSGNVRPAQMDAIFEAVMGSNTDQTTYYDFTLSEPGSMEMEIGEENIGSNMMLDYVGVGIKNLQLIAEAKEFVKFEASWLAKDFSRGTYSEPSPSAELPCVFYGASVTLDDLSTTATGFEININRNLKEDAFVLNDYSLAGLFPAGHTEITGTLTFNEREFNQLRACMFGSAASSSLTSANIIESVPLAIDFDNSGGTKALEIDTTAAIYMNTVRTINGRDEVGKKVDFKVIGDDLSLKRYVL